MPVANPFTYIDPRRHAVGLATRVGRLAIDFLAGIGDFTRLLIACARTLGRDRQRRVVYVTQLYHVGYLSLPVVVVFGVFVGLVVAVQAYATLVRFNAEAMSGSMVNYSLVSQLAPTFIALVFAGRVGSNMAAEIGTMKVTEQLDALRVMGTDPIAHLVAPRVLACVLLLPVLTAIAGAMGMLAASFLIIDIWGVDGGAYWFQSMKYIATWDILVGLAKTAVFGALIGLIACRQGLMTAGGATGVGEACTRGVVQASVAMMVVNFLLTLVFNKLYLLLVG